MNSLNSFTDDAVIGTFTATDPDATSPDNEIVGYYITGFYFSSFVFA